LAPESAVCCPALSKFQFSSEYRFDWQQVDKPEFDAPGTIDFEVGTVIVADRPEFKKSTTCGHGQEYRPVRCFP
jgi:hypothetical protein